MRKLQVLNELLGLAVSIGILDIVDTAIRLSLTTGVDSSLCTMASAKEGAAKVGAAVLSVDVVIDVEELATGDAVAHINALIEVIHETEGQVIVSLNSTSEALEDWGIASRWSRSRSGRRS
jgi:hypothetical protein